MRNQSKQWLLWHSQTPPSQEHHVLARWAPTAQMLLWRNPVADRLIVQKEAAGLNERSIQSQSTNRGCVFVRIFDPLLKFNFSQDWGNNRPVLFLAKWFCSGHLGKPAVCVGCCACRVREMCFSPARWGYFKEVRVFWMVLRPGKMRLRVKT